MKTPLPLALQPSDDGLQTSVDGQKWQPVSVALTQALLDLGTFGQRHSGRTLGRHLLGVYSLLKANGCDEDVCLAGGLHSIYGTDVFRVRTLPESARPAMARTFGARAEGLAWLFGHLTRRTRSIEKGLGDADETRALRLIEAANLIEQGGSLADWPNIRAAWDQQKESNHADG